MKSKEEHKSNEIVIDVKVDTSELDVLIEKLKEANSLADELASKNKRQGKHIYFFGDEEPEKGPTQWDQFKELFEEQNKALQEDNTEFIKQLQIDFEKEILIINGKEVKEPVIVIEAGIQPRNRYEKTIIEMYEPSKYRWRTMYNILRKERVKEKKDA